MDLVRSPFLENLTLNDLSISSQFNRIILVPICFNQVCSANQIGNCIVTSTERPGGSQSPKIPWISCFPSTFPNRKWLARDSNHIQLNLNSSKYSPDICKGQRSFEIHIEPVDDHNVRSSKGRWYFPTSLKVQNNVRSRNWKTYVVYGAQVTIRTIAVVSTSVTLPVRWLG
jgi:hypothetical protein